MRNVLSKSDRLGLLFWRILPSKELGVFPRLVLLVRSRGLDRIADVLGRNLATVPELARTSHLLRFYPSN